MKSIRLILLALVVSASSVLAQDWSLDNSHSSVNFAVSHLVVSKTRGEFKDYTGTASFNPADLSTIKANFTVQVGSVDTRDEKRDGHLKSADFFDVEKFPTMTFVSKSAKQTAPGKGTLTGDLTIRGVTKEVTFMLDGFNSEIATPWGSKVVGGKATATINRQDFGVSWNKTLDAGGVVVGDDVEITLELEFNRPA